MILDGQLFVARIQDNAVGLAGWRNRNLYNLYVDPNTCAEASVRASCKRSKTNLLLAVRTVHFTLTPGYARELSMNRKSTP